MDASELKIKIIKEPTEEAPYLILYKPSGLPSAPLSAEDKNNAFFQASLLFPEILKVHGKKEVEHGLLHRIDTLTDGLLLIAANQKTYDELIELQKTGKIKKSYKAVCTLNPENSRKLGAFPPHKPEKIYQNNNFTITSYFRPFGEGHKSVRPVTEESGEAALKKLGKKVIYATEVKIVEIKDNKVIVKCTIENGFRHQVRSHLAWIGLPIVGDPLYNSDFNNDEFCFTAFRLNINGTVFEI